MNKTFALVSFLAVMFILLIYPGLISVNTTAVTESCCCISTCGNDCFKIFGSRCFDPTLVECSMSYCEETTTTTTIPATTTTTTIIVEPCDLITALVSVICAGGSSTDCEQGEIITMIGSYTGDCSAADFFQIDAMSADGTCDIQYIGGDMPGIFDPIITVAGNVYGVWTIPAVPSVCTGKTVSITAAALYDGGPPGTGTYIDGAETVSGSFIFATPGTTTTVPTTTTTTSIGEPCNTAGTYCYDDEEVINGYCVSESYYDSHTNWFKDLTGDYSCGNDYCCIACDIDNCCWGLRGYCYSFDTESPTGCYSQSDGSVNGYSYKCGEMDGEELKCVEDTTGYYLIDPSGEPPYGKFKCVASTTTTTTIPDECTDSDNGNYPLIAGTCTDTTSHQDSCSGSILTEYYCSGDSCTYATKNCNLYDCDTGLASSCSGVGKNILTRSGDNYICSDSNPDYCAISGTKTCESWRCDFTKSCRIVSCADTSYTCYKSNAGSWVWGTSAEDTETACDDYYDNNCDGYIDAEDSDCVSATTTTTTTLPTGEPNLKITDISVSGSEILYRIENVGSGSTEYYSYSHLYVDGTYTKTADYIDALAAGAFSEESFSSYTWTCSGASDTIMVCADGTNRIIESDETNNCKTETWDCPSTTTTTTTLSDGEESITIYEGTNIVGVPGLPEDEFSDLDCGLLYYASSSKAGCLYDDNGYFVYYNPLGDNDGDCDSNFFSAATMEDGFGYYLYAENGCEITFDTPDEVEVILYPGTNIISVPGETSLDDIAEVCGDKDEIFTHYASSSKPGCLYDDNGYFVYYDPLGGSVGDCDSNFFSANTLEPFVGYYVYFNGKDGDGETSCTLTYEDGIFIETP